ncbi:DC-STAMP domain-containing protein [Aphelenchoides bicaudatus]|nr:DC-STAMP domain-containing protein [Aphelenchoides bicaudatus]
MKLGRLFIEEHREKRRLRLGRGRLIDIFWYSSVYDYRFVRMLYNFPIGFLLSYAVYELAWQRLNFAEFNSVYSAIFKWSLIVGSSFAFGISPVFRCASICVFVGGLGKGGQGVLSLYMLEQLNQGPMENIFYNIELTSNIIICHLELESEMINQRIGLTTGPLEEMFTKKFGATATFGKKVVKMLKALVEPFRNDLQFSNEEDKALAAAIDGSSVYAERQDAVMDHVGVEQSTLAPNNETLRPAWTKLKTELGRNAARRLQQRCEQTFAESVRKCHETFAETQAKCYDKLPIVGWFVCWQFNALDICQPAKVHEYAEQRCKFGKEMEESGPLSPDLDDQMESVDNISRQLTEQLKMNLHFVAVEQPQDERMRILAEIKSEIKSDVKFFRLVGKTINELLSTLLIILIYFIFRDTIQMIRSYLNDIEFKNHFTTSYFWYIDKKRQFDGHTYLKPITKKEIQRYNLRSPFSAPTTQELKQSWQPLVRFIITIFIALTVVMLDHYFYRVLYNVVSFGRVQANQQGIHTVDITVDGHGPIADMIRDIANFNFTKQMHREVSNRYCIVEPKKPNWTFIMTHIFLPLVIMLLLQVVFSYVIRRITLFYVVGLTFRKRSKARIIHLYNQILLSRENKLLKSTSEKKEKLCKYLPLGF